MNDDLEQKYKEQEQRKEKIQNNLFELFKLEFIKENKLLKRFYDFCNEYQDFEYDEMGMNMDEADDILRKTNKIRDKFLNIISDELELKFENIITNTLHKAIQFEFVKDEFIFIVDLELLEDSFNLEINEQEKGI